MAITVDSSLNEISAHLDSIYRKANRGYAPFGWTIKVLVNHMMYVNRINKAYAKGEEMEIIRSLPCALAWLLAFGRFMEIDSDEQLWRKFPGVCPYCEQHPHVSWCDSHRPEARKPFDELERLSPVERPRSFHSSQELLKSIYPGNRLDKSVAWMSMEPAEVLSAMMESHIYGEQKIVEEYIDCLVRLIAIANCLNISLAKLMVRNYGNGCPVCHLSECKCPPVREATLPASRIHQPADP